MFAKNGNVSGQTMPEKPAELTAAVTTYAPFTEPLSMHEDLFTVTTSESRRSTSSWLRWMVSDTTKASS